MDTVECLDAALGHTQDAVEYLDKAIVLAGRANALLRTHNMPLVGVEDDAGKVLCAIRAGFSAMERRILSERDEVVESQ